MRGEGEPGNEARNVVHNANHLTVLEVDAIVPFKASFGLPVEKVGQALAKCDWVAPSLN